MMGRLNHDQGQLFYSFSLEEVVPDDHLVRKIAAVPTCRGSMPSWRPIILTMAGPRLILS
jgi:hypothetical protein